ncbi:hypothetical protein RI367_007510 [Sorochytrium milnesiophthora]
MPPVRTVGWDHGSSAPPAHDLTLRLPPLCRESASVRPRPDERVHPYSLPGCAAVLSGKPYMHHTQCVGRAAPLPGRSVSHSGAAAGSSAAPTVAPAIAEPATLSPTTVATVDLAVAQPGSALSRQMSSQPDQEQQQPRQPKEPQQPALVPQRAVPFVPALQLKQDSADLKTLEAALARCLALSQLESTKTKRSSSSGSGSSRRKAPKAATGSTPRDGNNASSKQQQHHPTPRTFAVYALTVHRIAKARLYKLRQMNIQTYFKNKLDISRAQTYRIIAAGQTIQNLISDGTLDLDDTARIDRLPQTQSMCGEISRLASGWPERERMLWEHALATQQRQIELTGGMGGTTVDVLRAWHDLHTKPEWEAAGGQGHAPSAVKELAQEEASKRDKRCGESNVPDPATVAAGTDGLCSPPESQASLLSTTSTADLTPPIHISLQEQSTEAYTSVVTGSRVGSESHSSSQAPHLQQQQQQQQSSWSTRHPPPLPHYTYPFPHSHHYRPSTNTYAYALPPPPLQGVNSYGHEMYMNAYPAPPQPVGYYRQHQQQYAPPPLPSQPPDIQHRSLYAYPPYWRS